MSIKTIIVTDLVVRHTSLPGAAMTAPTLTPY